jgi:two-component SAPR family response regulator
MGLITIEVPQRVTRTYQIVSEKKAKELIDSLDQMRPKHEKERQEDELDSALNAVLGIWSDRKESTGDTAKRLRAGWNRKNDKLSG